MATESRRLAGIILILVPAVAIGAFGSSLGAVALLVGLGVMIGRILEVTGGAQVLGLLPAQGGFVELTLPDAGTYPFVSHLMVDAERGAHGLLEVADAAP